MDGSVSEWFASLYRQVMALPPGRRLALFATAAGSLTFFLWLGFGAARPSYRLLFRGLPDAETAKVVTQLSAEKISYELREGGSAVYVPAEQVYDARIRLAGAGLPPGGGAGFELFEDPAFGVTDFVHQVNYRRALQGELSRSIEQLEPVERARVLIALAERSPFVGRQERRSTASVVVRLTPGAELHESQVRGIVHLVASSVESLAPEEVTVVDDRGRMLAPQSEGGPGPDAPAGAHAFQRKLETDLAERVESILERTVGMGRVVARVRADLDWTRKESTEERYDPDSQIERSEQRTTESSVEGGAPLEGGVPGVRANVPDVGGPGGATANGTSSTRTSETINYEISKTVSHSVSPVGEIERLTVAVLVDGQPEAEGSSHTPWDEEALRQFEELAKQAVGFSPERGDTITVTSAPFRSIEVEEPEGGPWLSPEILLLVGQVLRGLGLLVALVLFAKLVVRPIASALASAPSLSLPASVGDVEMQLSGSGHPGTTLPPSSPSLSEQIGRAARHRVDDSVKTIRDWLRQS